MAIALIESLNFGLGHLAAAARRRGHELLLLTSDRSRYTYELSDELSTGVEVIDVDTTDAEKIIATLSGIQDLAGVVRMADRWTLQALETARRLGLPHQDIDAVTLLRDKGRLRKHLHDNGFSRAAGVVFDPHTASAEVLAGLLPFPCVIKDAAGSGSQNVWLARTPADVPAVLAAARTTAQMHGDALVAEPYFTGPMYSAETLTWGGRTRVLGISSRALSPEPYFMEQGASFPVAFPAVTERVVAQWISSILSSVGYRDGFTHTEFIATAHGFEIVEINSRMGGALIGESIRRSLGVDVHGALLDVALGRRPSLMDEPLDIKHGTAQVCIYAPRAGVFAGLDGTELLDHHPGDLELYPVRFPGETIASTVDQRGAIAFLLARGATAELAYHNAVSAAGKIGVRMA